ncbi:transglutaminase N-terminal domain-containing protein [Rubrivivax sp. A210]|uniref:transglutaminase family protein n=1 Tax=Rubrivivax sp. A210 TaxID=2772301 RepID=UPI0019194EE0|nr:transglutaminase family protein [Rubrivivax sp. A210]
MELTVQHETRYDYTAPVSLAHHLAHLRPLHDAHQQVLAHSLEIEPAPGQQRDSVDDQGNAQCHFSLAQPHRRLRVRAASQVRVRPRFAALAPAAGPAWDTLAARLRYVAGAPFVPELEYALPSPYVPRLRELRDFAAASFAPGRPVADAAIELMRRIHAGFRYESRSTDIDTPLTRVLEQRRGVCQDFAHLMAGMLRMLGLPARYVSGYLLTHAPEGGARMQGADASHAWVQVWCPGTPGVPDTGAGAGWLDLDPTNDVVPGSGHVRLAIGRDFGDVTPLRGVIRGGGRHTLTVGVDLRPTGQNPQSGPGDC